MIDTDPRITARMIQAIRDLPPWRRLLLLEQSRRMMRQLQLGRMRVSHPDLSVRQLGFELSRDGLTPDQWRYLRENMAEEAPPMADDQTTTLVRLCAVLDRLEIPYAIGGSFASSLYGIKRFTNDVDIVARVAMSDAEALAAELGAQFYAEPDAIRDAIQRGECFNVLDLATTDKADIFVATTPFEVSEIDRAIPTPIGPEPGALTVKFLTPEDTIISKLIWYRLGREISERQLTDVLGVLAVQSTSLDVEYMRRWSDDLGVRDLLDQCLQKAGLPPA